MKAFIHKIFSLIKSLFLRLRVIVTLQLGKDRVDEDDSSGEEDERKESTDEKYDYSKEP